MRTSKISAVLLLIVCTNLGVSAVHECYQQLCTECDKKAERGPGHRVRCQYRNMVKLPWLDAEAKISTGNNDVNVQFACLKMVASRPGMGDSTDVIRGCTLRESASTMCDALVGEELVRGKRDARCVICHDNLCNGAMGVHISIALMIFSTLLAKILNY